LRHNESRFFCNNFVRSVSRWNIQLLEDQHEHGFTILLPTKGLLQRGHGDMRPRKRHRGCVRFNDREIQKYRLNVLQLKEVGIWRWTLNLLNPECRE
jgi:hypothetical protein